MKEKLADELHPRTTGFGEAKQTGPAAWHLEIPAGPAGRYRLAQLDDYGSLPRKNLHRQTSFHLELQARASAQNIPGTWGFGLWNDPFSMTSSGGGGLRLPDLPNTAWFFFAGPPNYLSLREDLPAQGWLAQVFCSRRGLSGWLIFGIPFLPLLLIPPVRRAVRRQARRFIRQAATALSIDPTGWHTYRLEWDLERTVFYVNGLLAFESHLSPHGPLGLVIWIDNQFAAWEADGRLRWGTLANTEPAWIEIRCLE